MNNLSAAIPGALVKDPVLEPVDKLIGLVIRLALHETDGYSAFPSYDAISRMANVASRSTIARAMTILRATRWLSRSAPTHKEKGGPDSSDYVLHDKPLPLADALRQDPDYLGFLARACAHAHARVRAVAQGVLDAIKQNHPITQPITVNTNMLQTQSLTINPPQPRGCFSFSRKTHRRLRHDLTQPPVRISNSLPHRVRYSNSGCCSSSYINTTTTTTGAASSNFGLASQEDPPLVYPTRFGAQQRALADRCLRTLAPGQRQTVLDELEGRIRAEQQGMKPIYDEIRFLAALCQRAKEGNFQPNLGIKVREGRRRRSEPAPKPPEPAIRARDAQWQARKVHGKARIAEMRARLGQRFTTNIQSLTCGT